MTNDQNSNENVNDNYVKYNLRERSKISYSENYCNLESENAITAGHIDPLLMDNSNIHDCNK